MAITTLSAPLIETRKVETLQAQSLRKNVNLRDLNLIDTETIEYQGRHIKITKNAFKGLLSLLGMSQQFANRFEQLFTAEAKSQFINTMKNAMASNAGNLGEVTLVLNPVSKSIIGITKPNNNGISNEQFLNVAENIIDRHGFDITNWSVDPASGVVAINAFNPKANFEVKGLSDEVFTGGVSFVNSPLKGFQVLPYVNRMWCANGMTTGLAEEAYTLNSLDNESMEKFFEQINALRENNFAPRTFADRVRMAAQTPASLHEMQWAHNSIAKFADANADRWIPLTENLNAYAKAGFENMSADKMRGAKSNQSLWSVVNGLTHFATHGRELLTSNMQEADSTRLMIGAGELFGKRSFDHENRMPDIFGANALNNTLQVGAVLN